MSEIVASSDVRIPIELPTGTDMSHTRRVKRVLVVGSCGAGKSVLARALAQATGLPLIHLDREYWQPGWVETDKPAWHARVEELIARDAWIIDGNYSGTIARRLTRADAVVFLDLPRWQCMRGVLGRNLLGRFKPRPDMAPGCSERWNREYLEFLRYVWRFKRNRLPNLRTRLAERGDARLFTLTSRRASRKFPSRFLELVNERDAR